jgi:hypothetical protein
MRPYIVLPWLSGLSLLVAGLIVARRELTSARGLDKLVVLGPVFFAAPLAAFAGEHFTIPQIIKQVIPDLIPAKQFLVYFVGVALYAAAISFVFRGFVLLSASLVALMFLVFVVIMHVPNAMRAGGRLPWTVALRDLSFGAGAAVLAGTRASGWLQQRSSWMVTAGRVIVAIACVTFGALQIIHPAIAPGIPLQKMTPPWIPVPSAWGSLTGAIEIGAGGLMLADKHTRSAAAWLGLVVTLIIIVIYLPFVGVAVEGKDRLEALNYVWDTLLFAGTVLLAARADAG